MNRCSPFSGSKLSEKMCLLVKGVMLFKEVHIHDDGTTVGTSRWVTCCDTKCRTIMNSEPALVKNAKWNTMCFLLAKSYFFGYKNLCKYIYTSQICYESSFNELYFSKWNQLTLNQRLLLYSSHHSHNLPGDINCHYDVIKWKHFHRYWPFVSDKGAGPVKRQAIA